MHLNVFTDCTPVPSFEGQWRDKNDRSAEGYRSLDYWTWVAEHLERASVDALFFADVLGTYDVYRGSWRTAVEQGVQVPSIDPVLVVAALAGRVRHLGFAVTYSTTYLPPYLCARVFSTLDHLTGGRIAWNIVTSYLESASRNGLGTLIPHDERYDRAEEYLAVVRSLWEESWDDDAVVRNRDTGVFTDPAKVHALDHDGAWFSVAGPHQCEPSPQRTPVLYQAGASPRGLDFAAAHAEVVFLTLDEPRRGAKVVADLRERIERAGRDPESVRVLQGMPVLLGRSDEEVAALVTTMGDLHSSEGRLAKWCGWMDVDLAAFPPQLPVADIDVPGTRSALKAVTRVAPDREWLVGDVISAVSAVHLPMRGGRFMLSGTPGDVADQMEAWMEIAGVDGFNLVPFPPSSGVADIAQLLVPELQRRGLRHAGYDPSAPTLRERYFGAGRRYPADVASAGLTGDR